MITERKTKLTKRNMSTFGMYVLICTVLIGMMMTSGGCDSSPTKTKNGYTEETGVITMITTSGSVSLKLLPLGDITIEWGDGNTSKGSRNQGVIDFIHVYENGIQHTITILGNVSYLDSSNNGFTTILTSNNNALTLLNVSLNDLSTTALNDLFHSLNNRTAGKHIYIMGNPGALESDSSMAENKGWMVHGENDSEAPAVTLKTSLSNVSFVIFAISDFIVDWGDGNKFTGYYNDRYEIRHTYKIQTTHTISIYGKITQLGIGFRSLSDLNLSNASMLSGFGIVASDIGFLDISNNWLLESLGVPNNRLTSLDTSNNPLLRTLNVGNNRSTGSYGFNQITKLDLRNNILLESLDAFSNQLVEIDISNNSSLHSIRLDDNNLTSIDVTNKPLLASLIIGANRLTTIDLSNNPRLGFLNIGVNLLTSLDVSNNHLLYNLGAMRNQLSYLNLSNNPRLGLLLIRENLLTTLDLSNNPHLWYLDIQSNQFSNFDASNLINLERIYIQNNLFSSDSLNNLFHSLHDNQNITKSIFISDNPGSDDSDKSIAEVKGWRVWNW